MNHPATTWLNALFLPDDWVEMRLVRTRGEPTEQLWNRCRDWTAHLDNLQTYNDAGYNIYAGVNARTREFGGCDADCTTARCLFADFDNEATRDLALTRIEDAELPPPSILVHSGGGIHAYWLLEEPLTDMDRWRLTQKGIIAAVGSDPAIHNPSRIMRVPGFLNRKPGRNNALCEIIDLRPDALFPIDEFPVARESAVQPIAVAELPSLDDETLQKAERLAIDRMRRIAIKDRSDGSRRLLTAACIAVECALDDNRAVSVIRKYAAEKPFPAKWTDGDILDRIRDAETKTVRGSAAARLTTPTPESDIITGRPCTDLGNAERLCDQHGNDIHYVTDWNRWMVWNGKIWRKDETGDIERLAQNTVRNINREAAICEDDNQRTTLAKHAFRSEAVTRLRAMTELARSQPCIAITANSLDQDPYLLNTQNGIVDLRTGHIRAHARPDLCTRITAAPYDPSAQAPTFTRFLQTIFSGHESIIPFLQRVFGYCATGDVSEQCLFMAHGSGRNGKSTLFEAVLYALGEYGGKGDSNLLTLNRFGQDHPSNIADLQGARMVVISESNENTRWNEAKVKELTGEKTVKARRMYGDWFEFPCTHKLCVYGNHKPSIKGTDDGIWRRIHLIPFTVTIPEEQKDTTLPDRLRAEAPGILRWIVEGAVRWHNNGLEPPREVVAATADYRTESDRIAAFLQECCVEGRGNQVAAGLLYETYCKWASENGEKPISNQKFSVEIRGRGFGREQNVGTRRTIWVGLGVVENRTDSDHPI